MSNSLVRGANIHARTGTGSGKLSFHACPFFHDHEPPILYGPFPLNCLRELLMIGHCVLGAKLGNKDLHLGPFMGSFWNEPVANCRTVRCGYCRQNN